MLNLKNLRKASLIVISIAILFTTTARASAEDTPSTYIDIETLGKHVPVYIKGDGKSPLLILGPGDIFRNDLLPKEFFSIFTVYFVDFFRQLPEQKEIDASTLQIDDFIKTTEEIRSQLQLEKMSIFAHSIMGILALKYSSQYPERVIGNILVCTTPFHGDEVYTSSLSYFENNAGDLRKDIREFDLKAIENIQPSFDETYNARRTLNFYIPTRPEVGKVWGLTELDYDLINTIFSVSAECCDLRQESLDVKVPSFLALGRHDYTHPPILWTEKIDFVKHPMLEHHIFEKSAHWPMIEEEDQFMANLKPFIKNNNEHIEPAPSEQTDIADALKSNKYLRGMGITIDPPPPTEPKNMALLSLVEMPHDNAPKTTTIKLECNSKNEQNC